MIRKVKGIVKSNVSSRVSFLYPLGNEDVCLILISRGKNEEKTGFSLKNEFLVAAPWKP